MKVLVDGIIYSLKKTGGIRRYFDGFLPLLPKIDKDIKVNLYLASKVPILLPKTIFTPLIEPINNKLRLKFWKGIKGDIFHSTYYTRHPDLNIPQIVTVYDMIHELFPQYFSGKKHDDFRAKKKKAVESADAVICISENTKKDLLKLYKLNKNKVYVICPGVDTNTFKKIKSEQIKKRFLKKNNLKKQYFLFVGPRGRYKNFLSLIKAFSKWVKNKNFNLICVGGDRFTKKEKNIFKKNNLINQIKNFGFVDDSDLVLFYNCALAFINPSIYEGFGIPILEAMACGAPVLASKTSVFKEAGKDCFIYFNPKDKKDIVSALNKLLLKNKKRGLVNKGLRRVKEFSWQKTASQTSKIYRNFCSIQTKQ